MTRVVGIGGVFFKAKDPKALGAWYREHLGLPVEDWGGAMFPWDGPGERSSGDMTVWNLFEESSDYLGPSSARFMVNYIVRDLASLLAALRAEGCTVDPETQESEFGKFGWVTDPEGNRVELWEPPEDAGDET